LVIFTYVVKVLKNKVFDFLMFLDSQGKS